MVGATSGLITKLVIKLMSIDQHRFLELARCKKKLGACWSRSLNVGHVLTLLIPKDAGTSGSG